MPRSKILNRSQILTGDVGTEKTTLINALINSLGNKIIVAIVPDPGLEDRFFQFYRRGL